MNGSLIFAFGFLAGGGLMWLLWRTILLPHAVMEMRDLGLIAYRDEVIQSYRIDEETQSGNFI